jgi:hypothetical protein
MLLYTCTCLCIKHMANGKIHGIESFNGMDKRRQTSKLMEISTWTRNKSLNTRRQSKRRRVSKMNPKTRPAMAVRVVTNTYAL